MAEAIRDGRASVDYSYGVTPVGRAVCEKIEQWLTAKGYQYTTRFDSGDDNMGDFNAPCTVHWELLRMKIWW